MDRLTRVDLAALAGHLATQPPAGRRLVALAGPPGAGKSLLADRLAEDLNRRAPGSAAVLGMDGFHYDDRLLDRMGRRDRKGAPDTFDVCGLRHLLARLKASDEAAVAVPVFDRGLEIARAGAALIPADAVTVIVEGNYLLLDRHPWSDLRALFDVTVLVHVPAEHLAARLARRWAGLSPDERRRKLEDNDLPNGRLVMDHSHRPDFVLENPDGGLGGYG